MALLRAGRWLALAVLAALAGAALGRAQTLAEYDLKALYLYNFTQFVEWPPAAFESADSPLCIGVLGEDPFGAALERAVAGERIHGRPLAVQRGHSLAELHGCQLLFISRSERSRMPQILAALGTSATLTVSEIEGFAHRGGVIGFFLQDNRVRFEICPPAAERAALRISSQLLSLGVLVEEGS